jgi:hypothetical protein
LRSLPPFPDSILRSSFIYIFSLMQHVQASVVALNGSKRCADCVC